MSARRAAISAWIAAALGGASLAAERRFYGDVGEDGVLRESFLLPLGVGLIGIGAIAFIVAVVLLFRERSKE
ncbi:DUF3955 domain-containing protein [Ruegeria profundi]|uniref:DUF3955 domain-containing protein n=1 Tax=Ruegeria profundi TaxID=1685378 RepID=A0A0X3T906_9RHOB|nr:DUF3955 domain-containing protein [Ruegeria profundi]KUJ72244.1 hypothetical protein AVO44_20375 [Ruegeria profundi]